ncbi:MAG: APC family permease [Myxococcales bacterium]|nr:APC family permease [Myxococcales bacterium]MCB9735042.1 APC family permease [Deltaproteobacteria bacterium]
MAGTDGDQADDGGGTLGFGGVWALAAGGMVGGGIYTALGVVVAVAGQWTWLAFTISGALALASAHSYARLANHFGRAGGAFEFLEELGDDGVAGALAWILIIGYVLTMAVYAFAFGHYVAYALHGGPWVMRALAIGAVGALVALNFRGVGSVALVETVIVAGNLIVLVGLGVIGLTYWDPAQLVAGIAPREPWSAFVGAAAIFMAYEGFQLITYELDEIRSPKRILMPALVSAVVFVIGVYVLVALGAVMIAGALPTIADAQVALSRAADVALGTPGLIALTVAAAFATTAAINSTLFSTAKLAGRVADAGQLPAALGARNRHGVPARALAGLGGLAALLAIVGTLSTLVEAASLAFVVTFGVVNALAARHTKGRRWVAWLGVALAALIALVLTARLAVLTPLALALLAGLIALATVGRAWFLRLAGRRAPGDDDGG